MSYIVDKCEINKNYFNKNKVYYNESKLFIELRNRLLMLRF